MHLRHLGTDLFRDYWSLRVARLDDHFFEACGLLCAVVLVAFRSMLVATAVQIDGDFLFIDWVKFLS